jgi:hypothetical protein
MKVNISYKESLTFEQFKEKFEQYFALGNPEKKETEMEAAWEKAEAKVKSEPEAVKNGTTATIDYDDGDDDDDLPST